MANRLFGIITCLAISVGASSAALAEDTEPAVENTPNTTVATCARAAGVTGGFYVTRTEFAKVPWFTVPPGRGVTAEQSERINICIAENTPTPVALEPQTSGAIGPTTSRGCYTEYTQKLRISRNGRDYKGKNGGTRLLAGLLGRGTGAQILANEYERCLDRISASFNRCPNGVFSNGAGYCVRRPRR